MLPSTFRSIRTRLFLRYSRRFASATSAPEPKFSQSAAFQGRRRGAGVVPQQIQFDYYSSDSWQNKKILSPVLSLLMILVYFGWLREPSDLDQIWATPPHILTASLERRMLKQQIEDAKTKGLSTELLEAQLAYVDVKEEALRIQFEKSK